MKYYWAVSILMSMTVGCGSLVSDDDPFERAGGNGTVDDRDESPIDEGEPPQSQSSSSGSSSGGGGGGSSGGGSSGGLPSGTVGGDKRVFVTSVAYPGDLATEGGAATGIAGADALCQAHADDVGLGGAWVAWLSDYETNAIDRLNDGSFYRLDGARVFDSKFDIRRHAQAAIEIDEMGRIVQSDLAVWTGSNDRGQYAGDACADWMSSNSYTSSGIAGRLDATDESWTNYDTAGCEMRARLYCFER